MTYNTKLRLSDRKMSQFSGDTLILSGHTIISVDDDSGILKYSEHPDFTGVTSPYNEDNVIVDKKYVDSLGGGIVSGMTFTSDIIVSIEEGKTFGKYENGDVIPASGKTPNWVILDALNEALKPTLSLSVVSSNVVFGEPSKVVELSFSHIINSMGASVDSAVLEWRRGTSGGWTTLSTSTITPDTYTHNIDDGVNRFNTTVIQYQYTVVDSAGGSDTIVISVTPQAYQTPTLSITLNGSVTSPETQNSREKGNVVSSPSGSISSNRSLVDITSWELKRSYNGGALVTIASGSGLEEQNITIPSTLDDSIPTSVTSILYVIEYTDEYTSGTGGNQSISFKYFSFWGYNPNTTLTETQIEALDYSDFLTSDNLTWNNVTSGVGNYTYYAYPSTYPDFTKIMRGLVDDFNAWQKLTNVNVTNTYGESLDYKVWRTNASNAYTGDDLVIT